MNKVEKREREKIEFNSYILFPIKNQFYYKMYNGSKNSTKKKKKKKNNGTQSLKVHAITCFFAVLAFSSIV